MYKCENCGKEVVVTTETTVRACKCTRQIVSHGNFIEVPSKIIMDMDGQAKGIARVRI